MEHFKSSMLELIIQTSTNLPPDVRAAMAAAMEAETPGNRASSALDVIATNIDMSVSCSGPICQDTGMPTFLIHTPMGTNQLEMKKQILEAVGQRWRSRGQADPQRRRL
jgi:fumarate hydratase class I